VLHQVLLLLNFSRHCLFSVSFFNVFLLRIIFNLIIMGKRGRQKANYSNQLDKIIKDKYLSKFVNDKDQFDVPQRKSEVYEKISSDLKEEGFEVLPLNIFHAISRRREYIKNYCKIEKRPSQS
jgi:hypothetical protein